MCRNLSTKAAVNAMDASQPTANTDGAGAFLARASPARASEGEAGRSALYSARRPSEGGRSPPPSSNLPGISRGQQLRDVAWPSLGDGALLLLEHDLLVDGRLDVREYADGHREVRGEEVGDELGRVDVLLVVDPEPPLGSLARLHHGGHDALHHHCLPVVGRAEEERLAVLEPELVLELRLLVVHDVPGEIVVDVAVLKDLQERGPLV